VKLIKNLSIYTFTNALNSGAVFFLLPIVTQYLTAAEYGIYSLFLVCVQTGFVLLGISSNGVLQVEYFKLDKKHYPVFVSSSLFLNFSIFIFSLFICLVFDRQISYALEVPAGWLWMLPIIAFAQVVHQSILAILQVQDKPIVYGIFNSGFAFLNIGFSIVALMCIQSSWIILIVALLAAYLIIFCIGINYLINQKLLIKKVNKKYIKEVFKFGLPLIPHALSGLAIEFGNRIFLAKITSLQQLGIYNAGFQVGKVISLIETSFNQAFVPILFSNLNEGSERSKIKIVKLSYLFILALFIVTLLLNLVSPFIFKFFIGKEFQGGLEYVFLISLGYFLSGVYKMFVNYIFYLKKTYYLAIIAIFNIILSIFCNYYFINRYGAIGATYSNLVSFSSLLILVIIVSTTIYKMPWFFFLNRNERSKIN
jgi:O-antigen/teichoic acid export membrane protein